MPKFSRRALIFGLYLVALVAVAQYIGDYFDVPLWPAYMCMIFFFLAHSDARKVPHIILGAITGIAAILLVAPVFALLGPHIGIEASKIGLIVVLVYAIVAFSAPVPSIFNDYAFMSLTFSGLALGTKAPNPYLWMAVAGIGGSILIGGSIIIHKIVGPAPAPPLAD